MVLFVLQVYKKGGHLISVTSPAKPIFSNRGLSKMTWSVISTPSNFTSLNPFPEKNIEVFPKWNRNSVNSGNLINHCSKNLGQFNDPVSQLYLSDAVETTWFLHVRGGKF